MSDDELLFVHLFMILVTADVNAWLNYEALDFKTGA